MRVQDVVKMLADIAAKPEINSQIIARTAGGYRGMSTFQSCCLSIILARDAEFVKTNRRSIAMMFASLVCPSGTGVDFVIMWCTLARI